MDLELYIRLYLSTLSALNKSPHTVRNYRYDLNRFLTYVKTEEASVEIPFESFKKLVISFIPSLIEDAQGNDYQNRSINRKRSCIRSFIRYLSNIHAIPHDFADDIELLAPPVPSLMVLEQNEIHRTLMIHNQRIRFAKDDEMKFMHHRNKLAFLTLLDAGIKVSELIGIKWSYLHLSEPSLVVPKAKGLEHRIVPLSERLRKEFVAYRKRLNKLGLYDKDQLDMYVFFGVGRLPHHHVNPKTIERMVESICEEASIGNKEITAQALRYTMALQTIEEQTSVSKLTPLLGYARNSVTKHMYQEPLQNRPYSR